MATQYTSLLGLALPVTGELSGSWGDVVNQSITSLLDAAISGTTSLTTDADVTLTTTDGVANEARQAIILWNPASGTVTRNITAPAQSKIYTVINASGGTQPIVFRGAGPTTGVTIVKGESAVVAWNGTDFVKIGNIGGGGSFTTLSVSGAVTLSGGTANGVAYLNGSKVLTTGSALTFDGTNLGVGSGATAGYGSLQVRGGFAYVNEDGANTKQLYLRSNYGGSGPAIQVGGTDPLLFVLNSSEQMRLTSTGLGIGTSSPSEKLTVNGGIVSTFAANLNSGAGAYLYYTSATTSAELTALNPGVAWLNQKYNALTHIWNNSGSEQMRLTSTGLGIGTSSPADKLHVAGTIRFGANALYYGTITHDAVSTGANIYNHTDNGGHLFQRGGTTFMTLDSSGNLGLGVTPSAWGSALKVLQIGYGSFSGYPSATGAGIWLAANAYYDNTNWRYQSTSQATYYNQLSGAHTWYTAPSGTAGNAISFTQALTLNTNGALVLQGGDTAASGVGITFPATQSASSNANTLDDYEEGNWTPTNAGDATGTIANAVGEYVKVGRLVYLRGFFSVTANFTGANIGGLPFTPSGNTANTSLGPCNIVMNQAAANLACAINIDLQCLSFYTDNDVDNVGGLNTTNLACRFSITYQASA